MKTLRSLNWPSAWRSTPSRPLVSRSGFSITPLVIRVVRLLQWVAVVVVLGASALAVKWWHESMVMEDTAIHLDRVVERLQHANARLSNDMTRAHLTLSPEQIATVKREVVFVNELADKRGFSWSRLLADLEMTLPSPVALHTVRVNFQDSTVALHGSAASLHDVQTFMARLEQHAAFRQATLTSHRLEPPDTPQAHAVHSIEVEPARIPVAGKVDFQLTVGYRPSF